MTLSLLWPTFALVLLIFVVLCVLIVRRGLHVQANPPTKDDVSDRAAAARSSAPVDAPAANRANLFESPVLYFALVPLLMLTRHGDHLQTGLAWVFVILRIAHSAIQLGPNKVALRLPVYAASCLVLFAMWAIFAVQMISAAAAISAAGQGAAL